MIEQRIDRLERMFEAFLLNQEKDRIAQDEKWEKDRTLREKDRIESAKEMRDHKRLWSDLGLTQGEIAEEGIYRSLSSNFAKRGKIFDKISRNVVRKEDGKKIVEYDILAVNGTEILPIEVKNKLTQKDVDHFIEVQLPKLKSCFPEYSSYTVLGGVGGLVVKSEVEEYAKRKGLYVFTQHSDGNMELVNDQNFVGKKF